MRRALHRLVLPAAVAATTLLGASACGTDAPAAPALPAAPTLTIAGSGASAPGTTPRLVSPRISGGASASFESGNPSSVQITMYALYVGHTADCSDLVLAEDYGSTGASKDFMLNPVLFEATPGNGAYKCVAFRMSDVVSMQPATTFGACVAGTTYAGDIYRDGETDWKDATGESVIGHGTDTAPVDDHVTIFLSRDTTAALARGISPHQLIPLGSDLVVPARTTFYWGAEGTAVTDGTSCGVNPGRPSFQ